MLSENLNIILHTDLCFLDVFCMKKQDEIKTGNILGGVVVFGGVVV